MKNSYNRLNEKWLKANAVLQNLMHAVQDQEENVDVISSLDVLNDYMESMRKDIDEIELNENK